MVWFDYGYDSLKRVTSAVEKLGATQTASWGYTYDKAGNRTQQVRSGATGATAGTIGYTYNAPNRITSTTADTTTWTYDIAGNQTRNGITGQTATYNVRGAVTEIGASDYTAWGQGNTSTLTRTNGTATAEFLNSPIGLMAEKLDNGARAYTRTAGGDVVSSRLADGSRYYFVMDHLGSVVGMFAKEGTYYGGYAYSPYGETRYQGSDSALENNHLRYIGGYYDETVGLYRLGARYYDPTIARFTQYDPTGQEPNPYSYATCNPINASDPTGTVTELQACVFGLALAAYGTYRLAVDITAIVVATVTAGPTLGTSFTFGALAALDLAINITVGVTGAAIAVRSCL